MSWFCGSQNIPRDQPTETEGICTWSLLAFCTICVSGNSICHWKRKDRAQKRRAVIAWICCALTMKLLSTVLGVRWAISCVSLLDWPYLDSFGPNGVAFPLSSCNMEVGGGRFLWGAEMLWKAIWEALCRCWNETHMALWWLDIHKPSCIMTIKPKHRRTHACWKYKKTDVLQGSCRTFGTSLTQRRPNRLSYHLISCGKHTPSGTQTRKCCLPRTNAAARPLHRYHQVFLSSHWSPEESDCDTLWRFSHLCSLCYYETSTSDSDGSQLRFSKEARLIVSSDIYINTPTHCTLQLSLHSCRYYANKYLRLGLTFKDLQW